MNEQNQSNNIPIGNGNGSGNNHNENLQRKNSPRKFLFVSWESLSGDLAFQIKKEGHEVKAYIKSESDKDVYDGFFEKVEDWNQHVEWADVIIFDDVGFGKEADELRKNGKLVRSEEHTSELQS